MFGSAVNRFRIVMLTISVIFALSVVSRAGGFQLEVEIPSASDAQLKDAALIVRTYGCHVPANAKLTATAEGIVKGQRQSLPLTMTLSETGVYMIRQQWPSQGNWVLAITGNYNGITSSALVQLGPNGVVKAASAQGKTPPTRVVQRKITAQEIESALKSGNVATVIQINREDALISGRPSVLVIGALGSVLFLLGFVVIRRHRFHFGLTRRFAASNPDNDDTTEDR